MKWRGRRQSKNIEIIPADPIARIIQKEGKYTGGVSPIDDPFKNPKPSPYDRKTKTGITQDDVENARVVKTLNDLNRAGKNPIPTPNPKRAQNQKRDRIQVTPGKWTTK